MNGRGEGGEALSAPASAAHWRAVDRTGPVTVTVLPDTSGGGTTVEVDRSGAGRDGSEVALYTVRGGGHTWPGRPQPLFDALLVGPTSRELDATEIIWDFFATNGRDRS